MATVRKVDTHWFQDQLADKRLSQRKLAARLGLDPAAISLMLRGRRKMSVDEAREIARFLDVEVGEVLSHLGSNVVRGPASDRPRDGGGSGGEGSARAAMGYEKTPRDGGAWEAEFMSRWVELGSMLLRRPR